MSRPAQIGSSEMIAIAIIGGGVVGSAVARALALQTKKSVVVLEKEGRLAAHTSGRNSGVIHSGINQSPGSLKAKLCVKGSRMLREYCLSSGVSMKMAGTLVAAITRRDKSTLRELERRSRANGVPGVRIIDGPELRKYEPYAAAEEALHSPTGAIVDSVALVGRLARDCLAYGATYMMNARVVGIEERGEDLNIRLRDGRELDAKFLINCAGLHADEIAHHLGIGLNLSIVPFRGEYQQIIHEKSHLVNSMIYPAPNLELPFLGIHFTKTTQGTVIVGPNAALALGRESYHPAHIDLADAIRLLGNPGFIKLLRNQKFRKIALSEMQTSLSKDAFVDRAKLLVPMIEKEDLLPGKAGNRAQLIDTDGRLIDDFLFVKTSNSFHILNAVSPALTSSLAFADHIVDLLRSEGWFAN